jgi:hypothetical protein
LTQRPSKFLKITGINRGEPDQCSGYYAARRQDRVGKHQRRVRQALIALEVATTPQLFEYVWPHLDPDKRWPSWHWDKVRRAAERFAVPWLGPPRRNAAVV